MNKKKESIFVRIKNYWDGMKPEEKSGILGMLVGGICGISGSMLGVHMWQKKYIANVDKEIDVTGKYCYMKGVSDGQIKAYHDLLIDPKTGFNKLGMEVNKF